jgi:hypothetical protein
MRGLRIRVPKYALPALSPKKKYKRKKHADKYAVVYCLFAHQVHSAESCCNALAMSILEISVTCVTNLRYFGSRNAVLNMAGTYVALGLAIYQAYVILANRYSGT